MSVKIVSMLAIVVLAVSMSAAQEVRSDDALLFGALFRAQDMRDRSAAALQRIDQEIQENARTIKKAEEIIVLARQKNNKQTESVAQDALKEAREARRKNEETRTRLETAVARATASGTAIRSRIAANRGSGSDSRVQGMVAQYSGRVEIARKNGEKSYLDGNNPGFLEPGDEVTTYRSSSVEVQTLDGRGTVRLGEASGVTLEEDAPQAQVLRLVRGKIYSAVEKADNFEGILQEKMARLGSDFPTLSEAELNAMLGSMRARIAGLYAKKFEIRTPGFAMAVRGTRLSVELKDGEATEIAVFEGSVEAGDVKGEKQILVEEGFKVLLTKNGISGPHKITDMDKWWER
jgi:hypothetical protein